MIVSLLGREYGHSKQRNEQRPTGLTSLDSPVPSGALVLVIAMREPTDFFQQQIEQCSDLGARASNKDDREF